MSVLSLLVCALLVVAFFRGRYAADWWQWHRTDSRAGTWVAWDVVNGFSGVYVSYQRFVFDEKPSAALDYATRLNRLYGVGHVVSGPQYNPDGDTWLNRMGFGSGGNRMTPDHATLEGQYHYTFLHADVPYWFLMIVFLAGAWPGTAMVWRARRRTRRLHQQCCANCGYDLRASVDRCPECGQAFGANASATAAVGS